MVSKMSARSPVTILSDTHWRRVRTRIRASKDVRLASPRPECAVRLNRENHPISDPDINPIRVRRDASRYGNAGTFSGIVGTALVHSPKPQAAIGLLANIFNQIRPDLNPVGGPTDLDRHEAPVCRAIAELAAPIVSPRPKCPIPF